MKRIQFILGTVFLIGYLGLTAVRSEASTQIDVRVSTIDASQQTDSVYFNVENTTTRTTLPTCVGAPYANYWVLQLSGDADIRKAQISFLVTAYSTGRPIMIFGTGTCAIGGIEQAADIILR